MLAPLAGRGTWVARPIDGPDPDLLIHCSLASHDSLLPLVRLRGRPAVLFDMPGHGKSADWDGQGDFQQQTAQVAAALCETPTHVIGHSFGATVALRLAVMAPQKVRALTLIEPVFFAAARGTPAYATHRAAFAPFEAAIGAGDLAAAAEVFNGLWGAAPWARLPAHVREGLIRRIDLIPAGAPAIEEDNAGLCQPGVLEALKMPVTLIRGAESPPVIAAIHASLCARLGDATDHVVPGAGHMLPLTHTGAVAAVMSD